MMCEEFKQKVINKCKYINMISSNIYSVVNQYNDLDNFLLSAWIDFDVLTGDEYKEVKAIVDDFYTRYLEMRKNARV